MSFAACRNDLFFELNLHPAIQLKAQVYGHIFQGCYKALNVDDDDHYFETVSTYIHLNPVRAGLRMIGRTSTNTIRHSISDLSEVARNFTPSCRAKGAALSARSTNEFSPRAGGRARQF